MIGLYVAVLIIAYLVGMPLFIFMDAPIWLAFIFATIMVLATSALIYEMSKDEY